MDYGGRNSTTAEEASSSRFQRFLSVAGWHQEGHLVKNQYPLHTWMDNCLTVNCLSMGIRLMPDGHFSIIGLLNFCKVSHKVWLSSRSKVRP